MFERKPDILDAAADYQEGMIQAGISAIKADSKLEAKGVCYNCDEPVSGLFCDSDCRDDYEYREKRRKANAGG